ncbi:hypothetical protein [uncultured Tateyamaria sp.]|uniref:hypothetical protein n=1 Tax=uncultured Tateyamaria sp. TaxID=455651 RepID=UPI002618B298|nr:hypothetical protein [uncultured Tateyamaria sp.]
MTDIIKQAKELTGFVGSALKFSKHRFNKGKFSSKTIGSLKKMEKSAIKLCSLKEPQYEGMGWELDFIIKEARGLLKQDEVKKTKDDPHYNVHSSLTWAYPIAVHMHSAVQKLEKEYEKSGAAQGLVEADIVLDASNWENQSLDKNSIEISVRSQKSREATFTKKMSGGRVRVRGVMIPEKGYVHVKIKPVAKKLKVSERGINYALKGKQLTLSAELLPTKVPLEVEGLKQASKKFGDSAEIGLGLEWGVLSAGGKKITNKEAATMQSTKVKQSWVFKVPSGGMKLSAK